jgi:hypothetical protein
MRFVFHGIASPGVMNLQMLVILVRWVLRERQIALLVVGERSNKVSLGWNNYARRVTSPGAPI